jgi:hypothetical protein
LRGGGGFYHGPDRRHYGRRPVKYHTT